MAQNSDTNQGLGARGKRAERLALLVICLVAIGVIYITNQLLTERFTENTRNRA